MPGSNAIGFFEIGVSPIGSIPVFDPWQTIISQYANSPILDALVTSFFAAADPTELFDEFFDNMLNILTAVGYGLDVWGRILGINRVVQLPGTQKYFGFEQQLPSVDTFGPQGAAPFYSGESTTTNYALTDAAFLALLLAKAAYNITSGTITAINALMMSLFGTSGTCYCEDFGGMSMAYKFNFVLSPVQEAIVFQTGVMPKPCGVAAIVVTPSGSSPYNPPTVH